MRNKATTIKNKLLKATHEGELKIMQKTLRCAVLEDGSRILSGGAIFRAFDRPSGGSYWNKPGVHRLLESYTVQQYITPEIKKITTEIIYLDKNNNLKKGFAAEMLPAICDLYLEARKDNRLMKNQLRMAEASEMMVRSLANVGINALVDEATGYQMDRPESALQKLLNLYLTKEYSHWEKVFPNKYYEEIFRLKGWIMNKTESQKRPGCIGNYTNDLIYSRLAPGIREELKVRQDDNKYIRYHQFLTNELGHPALSQHMHTVIAFMKASSSWDDFYTMMERALPKKSDQFLIEATA